MSDKKVISPTEVKGRNTKEFYVPREMSRVKLNPLWKQTGYFQSVRVQDTNERIIGWLKDPYVNYRNLQRLSNYFWYTSTFYQNILYYLATGMTFDYLLTPTTISSNKNNMTKRLEKAAEIVWMSQVKSTFPNMLLRTLIQGETYWYDISDGDNTIFKEIPAEICLFAMIDENNIWRYYVDLSMIQPNTLITLPEEIQKAHKSYVKSGITDKKATKKIGNMEIPAQYYLVSPQGFAMSAHPFFNHVHDYPFLASMFPDLNNFENDKEYFNEYVKNDNIKLVHNRIPLDSDGEPLLEYGKIKAYHEAAKEHLPSNVAPLTNPFDTKAIALDRSQQATINVVELSQKNAQFASGVSDTMFSASTNTGLRFSILFDLSKIFPFLAFFENLMNYKLRDQKFQISFLPVTHYNKLDWYKEYRSSMAQGGSRWNYISLESTDLLTWLNGAKFADQINLDQYMPNKASAYQQSGSESKAGRPTTDDPSDETERGQEYQ